MRANEPEVDLLVFDEPVREIFLFNRLNFPSLSQFNKKSLNVPFLDIFP